MRKLTCVIALSTLLLAGCSQDEGIMESKGELVTLNYNVSLGNGVQSRAGEDLAVNKLLCTIFEVNTDGSAKEVKRDILDMTNGTAQYTPKLFSNVQYKIAFWAYCEQDGQSCFDLTDARNIKINSELYDKGAFIENKYKDAYTAAHEIKLTETKQTPSIVLNRPFGMVKVLTSKADYEAAVALGSTPTNGTITVGSCNKVYDAYAQEWKSGNDAPVLLNTSVSATTVQYQDMECYVLASEYVFGNGTVTTTNIQIMDASEKNIYNATISNMPLGMNMRTNMYNETLLTGGGVTYTVSVNEGFSDTEKNESL